MGYLCTDRDEQGRPQPRGEIWFRGPNIIPGYYKMEDKTKEAITDDGWLMSGDICILLPESNAIKLIDRKKNIFKLSQGEYIAPEKLEYIYKDLDAHIDDVFIYGESIQSCIIAIIAIKKEKVGVLLKKWSVEFTQENIEEIFEKTLIKKYQEIAVKNKLNGLEKPKGVIVSYEPWDKLDFYTTSLKKKRFEIKNYFKDQIDQLYKKL